MLKETALKFLKYSIFLPHSLISCNILSISLQNLFIAKNNDALHTSLAFLIQESTDPLLKSIFAESTPASGGKLNFISIGSKFRSQLQVLMDKLRSTVSVFTIFFTCESMKPWQCFYLFVIINKHPVFFFSSSSWWWPLEEIQSIEDCGANAWDWPGIGGHDLLLKVWCVYALWR